jgi:hypothetical protein
MRPAATRIALVGLALGLSACGTLKLPSFSLPSLSPPPEAPAPGVEPSAAAIARIRASLLTLRSDPALAARVPTEILEAEALLQKADASQHDRVNGAHRLYIAERRAEQVRALAELRSLEAEYETLRLQRDALKR